MTFTFPCINQARATCFYVLGKEKADKLHAILHTEQPFPAQQVGTPQRPALWIADKDAVILF